MFINPLSNNKNELVINDDLTVLFSYHTPVAAIKDGNYYRTSTKHSVTTQRHINEWLDGEIAIEMPQSFFNNLLKGENK